MNWFYEEDGKEVGPLTITALTELHQCGLILAETRVRPENSAEWIYLASVLSEPATSHGEEASFKFSCPHCDQHIAATEEQSGVSTRCPTCNGEIVVPQSFNSNESHDVSERGRATVAVDSDDELSVSTKPGGLQRAASSIASNLKHGAEEGWSGIKRHSKQAALRTQAEKLRNVDLRKAFHTLGKHCFEREAMKGLLAEQFQAARDVNARISENREKAEVANEETKMATLKRKGRDAASAGYAQALTLKREHLITELGRQAYALGKGAAEHDVHEHFEEISRIERIILAKGEEAQKFGSACKKPIWTVGITALALLVVAVAGVLLVKVFVSGSGSAVAEFADQEWTDRTFSEALELDRLQQRNVDGKARHFFPNAESPVTGWVKVVDRSSRTLIQLKAGVREGPWACFYMNGQIQFRGAYKDGEKRGIQESWYENGQKKSERLFEDALVSVKVWKPNGEPCPKTHVEDGNGKEIGYADDGSRYTITTWENGNGIMEYARKEDSERLANVMAIARAINDSLEARGGGNGRLTSPSPGGNGPDYSESPDFDMGFRAGTIGKELPHTNRGAYLAGRRFGAKSKSMPAYTQGYNQGREHGARNITMRSNPYNKISQKVEWLSWDHGYSIGNGEGMLSRSLSR